MSVEVAPQPDDESSCEGEMYEAVDPIQPILQPQAQCDTENEVSNQEPECEETYEAVEPPLSITQLPPQQNGQNLSEPDRPSDVIEMYEQVDQTRPITFTPSQPKRGSKRNAQPNTSSRPFRQQQSRTSKPQVVKTEVSTQPGKQNSDVSAAHVQASPALSVASKSSHPQGEKQHTSSTVSNRPNRQSQHQRENGYVQSRMTARPNRQSVSQKDRPSVASSHPSRVSQSSGASEQVESRQVQSQVASMSRQPNRQAHQQRKSQGESKASSRPSRVSQSSGHGVAEQVDAVHVASRQIRPQADQHRTETSTSRQPTRQPQVRIEERHGEANVSSQPSRSSLQPRGNNYVDYSLRRPPIAEPVSPYASVSRKKKHSGKICLFCLSGCLLLFSMMVVSVLVVVLYSPLLMGIQADQMSIEDLLARIQQLEERNERLSSFETMATSQLLSLNSMQVDLQSRVGLLQTIQGTNYTVDTLISLQETMETTTSQLASLNLTQTNIREDLDTLRSVDLYQNCIEETRECTVSNPNGNFSTPWIGWNTSSLIVNLTDTQYWTDVRCEYESNYDYFDSVAPRRSGNLVYCWCDITRPTNGVHNSLDPSFIGTCRLIVTRCPRSVNLLN